MKPLQPLFLVLMLAAPVAARTAQVRLHEWPLNLTQEGAPAYRLRLPWEVYAAAGNAPLRLEILDADGRAVPALLQTEAQPEGALARVPLPWFVLPAVGDEPQAPDVSALSERSSDGRIVRVAVDAHTARAAEGPPRWLLDASRLDQPMQALVFEFAPGADFETQVQVETSDDLQHWQSAVDAARLLRLSRAGQGLQQLRLPLAVAGRYLRITSRRALPVGLQHVGAEVATPAAPEQLQWQRLAPKTMSADGRSFEFSASACPPVDAVDVALPGRVLVRWQVESRDSQAAGWVRRAGPWTAWQLGAAQQAAPQLFAPLRECEWRLRADAPVAGTPQLMLGWQPEEVVFAGSGRAPYRLRLGHPGAAWQPQPMRELLARLDAANAAHWQPVRADLAGPARVSALKITTPADTATRRNHWLWAVLVVCALAVAGFAWMALRQSAPAAGEPSPPA